jgi:hypothetical protein
LATWDESIAILPMAMVGFDIMHFTKWTLP